MSRNYNAPRDDNAVPTAIFAQQGAVSFVAPGQIDQITGRILVDISGGTNTSGTEIPTGTIDDTDKTHSDDHPVPPDPILEKLKKDLNEADTLEKLQEVYLATTPQYRKLTLTLKDQIKEKLTPKTT